MAKLEEKPRRFLDENPHVGVATTLREDGSPYSTIVWVDVEDGKVSFNTARGRAKAKHLERDPRASLLMDVAEPGGNAGQGADRAREGRLQRLRRIEALRKIGV